jgi:hypothetical protein
MYALYMKPSPFWQADSHSASQEIPRLLWNLKVHYRIQKTRLLISILRQMQAVYNLPPLPKIQSNIIFPSTYT